MGIWIFHLVVSQVNSVVERITYNAPYCFSPTSTVSNTSAPHYSIQNKVRP
ncbi:MAG: hypothetical protein ACI85O_003032 [Saprospiraceae bacterium]|jgi:hypothetical protein